MIIRSIDSTNAMCITQIHHSLMTGELAKAWDPGVSAVPALFHLVVRAATLHDIGWLEWEARAEIDPDTGHPYDFLNMPKKHHLDIWKSGFYDSVALNEVIGLLVLRHNLSLAGKDDDLDAAAQAEKDRFFEHMVSEDNRLEASILNEYDELQASDIKEMNAFIMLVDYISLRMCMGTSRPNPFGPPPDYKGLKLEMEAVDGEEDTFYMRPWPFNKQTFEWSCKAWKHTRDKPFEELSKPALVPINTKLVPG